jgi:Fe2+ or Zn2+ uptake regulation protein
MTTSRSSSLGRTTRRSSGRDRKAADTPPETDLPPSDHSHEHSHDPLDDQHGQHRHHGHHDHEEQARELLRARGLRITGPRTALLKTLLDAHRPTSAQELIDSGAAQGMDHVTVYRTLNTLVEEGIAQAVGTTDRGRRFEVHACEGCRVDHPHLECRSCGDIQCLEHGLLPAMLIPTDVGGFLVEEAKLYLYGKCAACQRQKR